MIEFVYVSLTQTKHCVVALLSSIRTRVSLDIPIQHYHLSIQLLTTPQLDHKLFRTVIKRSTPIDSFDPY